MFKWTSAWEDWYRRLLPAYWVFLFCCTHFPKPRLAAVVPGEDKLVHFVVFGVLAFLTWRFAETFQRPLVWGVVWRLFAGLVVYAWIDEYLQQFVNRSTSFTDWIANVAGIVAVMAALELRRRRGARSARNVGPPRPT